MNKRALLIVAIVTLFIISGVVYLLTTDSTADVTEQRTPAMNSQNKPDTKQPSTQTGQTIATAGTYVDYRDGIIAETTGTKLLFFHAPWCSQCRALEADIKAKGVPDNVTIIKVDFDSNQKLRQQYGVTLQTTVVKVDDDGNLLKKTVPYDEPSLATVTKELL